VNVGVIMIKDTIFRVTIEIVHPNGRVDSFFQRILVTEECIIDQQTDFVRKKIEKVFLNFLRKLDIFINKIFKE
jgi:hypothetical protein